MAKEIRIVSDGTPKGTKVLVDDEELSGITHIQYDIDAKDRVGTARITFIRTKIDAKGYVPDRDLDSQNAEGANVSDLTTRQHG